MSAAITLRRHSRQPTGLLASSCVGMISHYNTVGLPEGPRNIMFVVGKCIRLEGLDVANYFNLLPEFHRDLSGWIRDGNLVWKESVEQGIENAPTAFLKLFKGENFGKMLVKLA
jgi:NADPH-dependent curcumin reductase CurA